MSDRLRELIDRVCGTTGPIASALSASEWHELQEELANQAKAPTSEQIRIAVHEVKETLYSGGSLVCLPTDSFVERAVRKIFSR